MPIVSNLVKRDVRTGQFLPDLPSEMQEKMLARFWSKVAKSDGCWNWLGFIKNSGYGTFFPVRGKCVTAHRMSWLIHFGDIPIGHFVCHHCDNKQCVRPDHLFIGTCKDNMRDCVAKGRHNYGGRARARQIMTPELVQEIRQTFPTSGISQAAFAARYGLSRGGLWAILRGTTWKHLLPKLSLKDT